MTERATASRLLLIFICSTGACETRHWIAARHPCFISLPGAIVATHQKGRHRQAVGTAGQLLSRQQGRIRQNHGVPSKPKRNPRKNIRVKPKINSNGGSNRQDGHLIERRLKDAKLVEKLLIDAVKKMSRRKQSAVPQSKLFPSVRQCNAALATFGDSGEFRRALRLFTQMKRSASLFGAFSIKKSVPIGAGIDRHSSGEDRCGDGDPPGNHPVLHSIDLVLDPPKPTLVTYSVLMARAVSLGKPRVALRLWNLMQNQPEFYGNVISRKRRDGRIAERETTWDRSELSRLEVDEGAMVPDVIFCNTLMNAYAKLGDHAQARSILNAMLGAGGAARHEGIPPTDPTVVTYNTLADACKVAGELGAALEVPELMIHHADAAKDDSLLPDAQTYTILISTVARKKKNDKEARDVRSGGENDPDMAFALLNRMINEGLTPNGVTYCALIDVCSRCRRNDLALNGLRIMLKQKSKARLASPQKNVPMYKQQALFNEVGAWTAAINACGKTGRVDTAIRLFRTMQKFGVKPNSVTCGCLSDCLLKATPMRMTETLEVLQYMKHKGLVPGEVMYTSLMGVTLALAEKENRSIINKGGLQVQIIEKFDGQRNLIRPDAQEDRTSESIVLYTELMRCLVNDGNDDMLLKVFLVFQEMRNAGATPDVACYNALLRACAFSGDVDRAQDVLHRMDMDGIEPNRNSWREAIRAAQRAQRSDVAEAVWNSAVNPQRQGFVPFSPKASDVALLMRVYVSELKGTSDHDRRNLLNKKIIGLYEAIISRSEDRGLHHESLSVDEIENNQEFMLSVLRAAVSNELHGSTKDERTHSRDLACEIAGFEVFQQKLSHTADRASKKAFQLANNWLYSY